tara:strand:+ start:1322 stop:1687 length:366 start_codon:yes stop_codon:yes gene_type:complete
MSYALVDRGSNQTIQFVTKEEECFEVHEDFKWVDIPDDWVMEEGTNPPDFFWNEDKQQVERVPLPEETWEMKRQVAYEHLTVEQQLGNLYDDIEAGVFGDIKGKSKFYTAVKSIKDSTPKG